MVLMAAIENDHHHHRKALLFSPVHPPLLRAAAVVPPRLHDFSFPTLSWGTHRLLRCSKTNGPGSSPAPGAAPQTPYPSKEEEARGSAQRAQGPWNLRARRSATAAPTRPAGSEDADEEAPAPAVETKKKRVLSVALSKQEIVEDFAAIRGTRPPRRPKKRPRTVQRQLDLLYPGLCLADVTPGSYKIEER